MEAIESVRQQTYTHWEIVLVDDASTDNSHELYKDLEKDERIHIYYNERNMGCGYTKRRCAELAQGEICGFLDPDDALLPKALELEVGIHMENPNVAIVYSKPYHCDDKYNILGYGELPKFMQGDTYLEHRMHEGPLHFSSYKNSYYKMTEGINPQLKAGVDQDLYFRVEEKGDIYPFDEFTYKYVVQGHPNALSKGENKDAFASYWNLIARRDAFMRRGKSEDELVNDVRGWLIDYAYKKELLVRSSYAYRLGKFLLRPFSWIKQ